MSQNTFLGGLIEKHVATGTANAITTVSTPVGNARQILQIITKYSATPVQAGVTIVWDNGSGPLYDVTLNTGTANAATNIYVPSGTGNYIAEDDVITVTAPAGGGVITSSISVYTRVL
jgi:hypothetical protein